MAGLGGAGWGFGGGGGGGRGSFGGEGGGFGGCGWLGGGGGCAAAAASASTTAAAGRGWNSGGGDVLGDLGRDSHVRLVITVRSSDDNVELLAVLAHVRSHRCVNVGAPESALEACHRWRVGAPVAPDSIGSAVIRRGVERGVTLSIDVERCAKFSSIALGSAQRRVIRVKSVQAHVRLGAYRTIEILEHLSVLGALRRWNLSRGRLSKGMK